MQTGHRDALTSWEILQQFKNVHTHYRAYTLTVKLLSQMNATEPHQWKANIGSGIRVATNPYLR